MGRVENKVALITGAARGQGRAHALRLAQEGANIIAVDMCRPIDSARYDRASPADLAITAANVEALGQRVATFEADVRDEEALRNVCEAGVVRSAPWTTADGRLSALRFVTEVDGPNTRTSPWLPRWSAVATSSPSAVQRNSPIVWS